MNTPGMFDEAQLRGDLQLAVQYAARAGLIREDNGLARTVAIAEAALLDAAVPDGPALTQALSQVMAAIQPITLHDLRSGRDPFSAAGERRMRWAQAALSVLALTVMSFIGAFTGVLQDEQRLVAAMEKIPDLHPDQKLTALRKLARDHNFSANSVIFQAQYDRQLDELERIYRTLDETHQAATAAYLRKVWWPFNRDQILPDLVARQGNPGLGPAPAAPMPAVLVAAAGSAPMGLRGDEAATPVASDGSEHCQTKNKTLMLPPGGENLPEWIQGGLRELVEDYCFRIRVLDPDGSRQNGSTEHLRYLPDIRMKLRIGTEWLLPFLFGLLGTALRVVRTVTDVRQAAPGLFPLLMRLTMGGVAGIVIGWFAGSAAPPGVPISVLSLPLALAFLTGYGIEVLFRMLDRMSLALGQAPAPKAAP